MSVSIKPLLWEKELINSRLEFELKGVSYTIVNTLRRVVLSRIPIYGFNKITISENTSVFNNNYMKLRIRNMPVFGINADNPIFVPIIKKETVVEENDLAEVDVNPENDMVNSSSLKQLTMYVDYVNNSNEIITVGSDDCKFYYMEKQINSPYPINIPIIKLQPTQKIKMSAITELGIEDISSIYSPVSIFTYKQLSADNFIVIMESRGQLNEKQILQYAYDNIRMILDNFLKLVPDIDDIQGKLQVNDADHTLGNIIAEGLMNHKKVKFGGYNSPHLLDKKIIFQYELNEKISIKKIMNEIVNVYMELFTTINKLVQDKIN
jgi:DNA-directed RNA polymerase subunit L